MCLDPGPGNYHPQISQDKRRADQAGLCPGLLYLFFNEHAGSNLRAHFEFGCPFRKILGNDEDHRDDLFDDRIRMVYLFPTPLGLSGTGDSADDVNQQLAKADVHRRVTPYFVVERESAPYDKRRLSRKYVVGVCSCI